LEFSQSVGLPPDQIKYVSALLAGIPIGFIFRAVTADPFKKEVKCAMYPVEGVGLS
jgi:hypothetical protein